MTEKKEIQARILKQNNGITTKEEFSDILKYTSPGTNLRSGLNNILKSGRGSLIVISNESTHLVIDGGFKVNSRFTPQRLVELAKMDGAIILSKDMRKILNANVLLTPDHKIPSKETGTKHKAAERTAKMTKTLVIAISERKKEINLYYKNIKYHLRPTAEIMRRITETLQIIEKHRELFDLYIEQLNRSEIKNNPDLKLACKAVQKGKTIQKILKEKENDLIELGNEGREARLRLRELIKGVEKETNFVIKDYTKLNLKKSKNILDSLKLEELIESENILTSLAQNKTSNFEQIKGWRLLSKTNLEDSEIASLIQEFKSLDKILGSEKNKHKTMINKITKLQF